MCEPSGNRARLAAGLLLPLALLVRWLAFRTPELTERWYGHGVYPAVGRVMQLLTGWLPFSAAEVIGLLLSIALMAFGLRWLRASWRRGWSGFRPWPIALGAWTLAGVVLAAFLLLWGLNYARPGLAARMSLDAGDVQAPEVLDLGHQAAALTRELSTLLGQPTDRPTTLPMSFEVLNRSIDASFEGLALPGDGLSRGAPAKRLWASPILSRLGISGVFIPFTGEPSINGMVPDVSLPIVVAHEKAHQRGIANEGEANLAAVLACIAADQPYARYSAWLYVASRSIGASARYLPEEAGEAWQQLGPGPLADLAAEREFWDRFRGPAREVATRMNDAYLRSNRVPGGVQSYGQVIRLLIGARRAGALRPTS